MRTVVIVQARMSSSRFPGKVLHELCGKPMIRQQLSRLQRSQRHSEIVIATTDQTVDDRIVSWAQKENLRCLRGSTEDVLARYIMAAKATQAEVIVRITADCPLVDPIILDTVVTELIDHQYDCDYASNVLRRTYPRGLDVEAFFADTLFRMSRYAVTNEEREHVTVVVRGAKRELFATRSIEDTSDNSDLRWTVDTEQDFKLIEKIWGGLQLNTNVVSYREILAYVRSHPELSAGVDTGMTWDPNSRTS